MDKNPYRYEEPLTPGLPPHVCIPREKEIGRIAGSIQQRSDYWSILGPRKIGKTTFLNLLQHYCPDAYSILVDSKSAPQNNSQFYPWLTETFKKHIPSQPGNESPNYQWQPDSPELEFYEFLKNFRPKEPTKKIILMMDDIDSLPFIRDFLFLWRKTYNERYHKKELNRYILVITGSASLISITLGPNSPYNVAETLFLSDFSLKESEILVEKPLIELGMKIEPEAMTHILTMTSGHPQILQHTMHQLAEQIGRDKKIITINDVYSALKTIKRDNHSLTILARSIEENHELKNLLISILNGKIRKFHPFKEYSYSGAGVIIEKDYNCVVRNLIFEDYLRGDLQILSGESS